MKIVYIKHYIFGLFTLLTLAGLISVPVSALTSNNITTKADKSSNDVATSADRLQLIISHGNTEIERRLTTLKALDSKIASATKLSSSDSSQLTNNVNSDISQLTTLKTQLDGATTISAAISDTRAVILDYRVYVLLVPQVNLIKTAGDQQATEAKLTNLADKLSSRLTTDSQAGADVASLESLLSDLNSKVKAAQGISSSIETGVISLTPSDYNTNHDVLSGDRNQLETAQSDIKGAISDAQSIISQLKNSSTSSSAK
jgi:hypothetical protein